MEFIFVYGTLRQQTGNRMHHVLTSHCEYISEGYMQGKLYEVNGYPGAIESDQPDDKVHGELYKIVNSLVLHQLDDYEECTDRHPIPHEYIRKKLSISVTGNGDISAWVYVFNHDVSNLLRIESGDYLSK